MSAAPYIVDFYSFKGGVGRNMSLVNVAYLMAHRGRNVLIVDLDLEAPGLGVFLKSLEELGQPSSADVIDLLSWADTIAECNELVDGYLSLKESYHSI